MSDDDIDLDRVVADPDYRRRVMAFLSTAAKIESEEAAAQTASPSLDGRSR